jgi:hypothetical protein
LKENEIGTFSSSETSKNKMILYRGIENAHAWPTGTDDSQGKI